MLTKVKSVLISFLLICATLCLPVAAQTDDIVIANCNALFDNNTFSNEYTRLVSKVCEGQTPTITTQQNAGTTIVRVNSKFTERVKEVSKQLVLAAAAAVGAGAVTVVITAATSGGLTLTVAAGIFTATTVASFSVEVFLIDVKLMLDNMDEKGICTIQ